MVLAGDVEVAGEVQREPRWQVVLGDESSVSLGGSLLLPPVPGRHWPTMHRLLLVHKPRRCHCERFSDVPRGGTGTEPSNCIWDLVPPHLARADLGAFGRLDVDTTGLLLMGTDGGLQSLLMHPSTSCTKAYVATLYVCGTQRLRSTVATDFAAGVTLADGHVCLPATLEVIETVRDPEGGASPFPRRVRVTLQEGKFHQIKRMLGACGAGVEALHRDSIGGISLDTLGLTEGAVMEAGEREIELLRTALPRQRVVRTV